MKPAEKNPGNEAASLPNLGRRKFLRNLLIAGTLAPLACSKEPTENSRRITLFQNRPFQFGNVSLLLTSCGEGAGPRSASIQVYNEASSTIEHSVSMLVPSSFGFQANGFECELYVESVSYGIPNSVSAMLVKKEAPIQDGGKRRPDNADLFTIGAALGFLGSVILAILGRDRLPRAGDGIPLTPRRRP